MNDATIDDLVALHDEALGRLWGGKRVNDAVYLHCLLVAEQADAVKRLVAAAQSLAGLSEEKFGIVRISGKLPEIALLDYPGFFDEPFPQLSTSWLVDLTSRRATRRDFENQANGLILHRKELMLPPDHAARTIFAELTDSLEDLGAFDGPSNQIGRRLYWDQRLNELGIEIEGHKVRVAPDRSGKQYGVARHKTALSRKTLSSPVQALARAGFVRSDLSLLDYGCGRGDDVRVLQAAGIGASGWDPHFAPDTPLEAADVVNLGFVLNVIENEAERREALSRAFVLARRVLAIAVMVTSDNRQGRGHEFRDGLLTRRGTFQRYFTIGELHAFTSEVLGREPVPIAPGLVFVFRTDEDEQAFLAARQRTSARAIDSVDAATRSDAGQRRARPTRYERHQELLDAFWGSALELGRLPAGEEFEGWTELVTAFGNARRAFASLPFPDRDHQLAEATARRRGDLLVYLALNLFERRRSAENVPEAVLRDIRGVFGSYKAATAQAHEALFQSGSGDHVQAATTAAAAEGLGVQADSDLDYTFHASLLAEQPPLLRILVGCAGRLEAIPADVDLLKVHGGQVRVSYLWFDDFAIRPMPLLRRRVVVDLRRQRIDEIPANAPDQRRVLLGKGQLMPRDAPGFEKQERFDALLRERGVFIQAGLGPNMREVARRLVAGGIDIRRPASIKAEA